MRNYLGVVTVALLSAISVWSQAVPASSIPKPVAAAPAANVREKFDPARDPKTDLEKAIKAAATGNKNIIIDLGGEWCGWCVFMDKFFVQNPELAKIRDDNFVWVKVNYSEENKNTAFLAAYPAAAGYPHLYVLDQTGKLLHSEDTSVLEMGKGYDPVKFAEFLKEWSPKPCTVDQPPVK